MLNITIIENYLQAWFKGIVENANCIIANPSAPRPSENTWYSTIHIMSAVPHGWTEKEMDFDSTDDTVDIEYSDLYEIMVSVNTFYLRAFQLATQLRGSLQTVSAYDYFSGDINNYLNFLRSTDIRDLTTEINKKMEERAQFDCFFTVRSLESETIETIRKIEVTNNINDDGDTVTIEHP